MTGSGWRPATRSRSGTSRAPPADLYAELRRGGFCTALAGAAAPLDPRAPELELQRAAARRGCAIERAIIMVDRSRRHDPDVRELMARDANAGIATLLVDAVNALPAELEAGDLRLGLWDGVLVSDGSGGVSRRPEDRRRATAVAQALRDARPDPAELILDEPLARAAALARALAPEHCDGRLDPDCTVYHGLLQDLRLLGLAASPQRHGRFYRAALAAIPVRECRPRVLIAGAADASMLVHVRAACTAAGHEPEVTVIDRCATPLEVCRWYAEERDLDVRTRRADVTAFEDPEPYDAICTESLLTLLQPAERAMAVARWRGLLSVGGRIVTTVRIADLPEAQAPAPASREAFAAAVRHEADRRSGLLDVASDVLERRALRYHGVFPLYPMASVAEVEQLFAEAGLRMETLEVVGLAGRVPVGVDAVGSYRTARYARVVAVR